MMQSGTIGLCLGLATTMLFFGCNRQAGQNTTAAASPTPAASSAPASAAPGKTATVKAVHVSPPVDNPELDGYCPVALVEMKALEMGSPTNQSRFEDEVYQMTNNKSEVMFQMKPERYVPPFSGDDPVEYKRTGNRVPGDVTLFVVQDDKAWFFINEDNQSEFQASPDDYVRYAISAQ